ncbi:hypothetical protein JYU34_000007 [Plutella xylostella]|uniref:FP protein C-terminal domain-containing protein n=1 Tax=Plutella xylostella TaxID=51655 RepID=A0ABQ7R6P6_PLUXY|nr:hypothetical protein JYU34_000007 [Plutella xylostella]
MSSRPTTRKMGSGSPSTKDINLESLMRELQEIHKEIKKIKTIKEDLKGIRTDIEEIRKGTQDTSDRISDVEKKLMSHDKKISSIKKLESDISQLTTTIKKIQNDNEHREQGYRMLNIELTGIPETKSENLQSMLMNLANKCDVPMENADVEFVSRVAQFNPGNGRPRSIIAKLKSKLTKDTLISAARKKRLTTSALGLPGKSTEVFVSEHLTPSNKLLLKKTKTLCKDLGFQYVWVRNCRIFVRCSDGANRIQINCEDDLSKLSRNVPN